MIEIPKRPDNDNKYSQLLEIEKDMIVEAVLFRLDNNAAFLRFNPQYAASKGQPDSKGYSKFYLNQAGVKRSKQFWGYAKVREFRDDYERTLSEFFGGKKERAAVDLGADISEADKAKALRSMFRYVIDNSIEIDSLDDPTTLLKIADKIRFFDQLEQKQEAPRRYLPETCSQCRMKEFVETAVANGDVEDLCKRCRALKIAEEHGFRFNNGKDLLEPIDSNNSNE